MVKMVNLKRSKADKKASGDAMGMPGNGAQEGVLVHLDHDHMTKMGMDGPLAHGTEIEFGGKGTVSDSGTHDDENGPRHHMTIVLHCAGVEHGDADDRREGLRADIEKAAEKK